MNLFPKNLRHLRRISKLTQADLASQVNKLPSAISSWEKEGSEPSIENLLILSDFFGITLTQLIQEDLSKEDQLPLKKNTTHPISFPVQLLPIISTRSIVTFDKIEVSDIKESVFVPQFKDKGADFLIRMDGDNMQPTFKEGQLLACRKMQLTQTSTVIRWGEVYVINTQHDEFTSRLFPANDASLIECRSDNTSNYPAFHVPISSIKAIAMVVGHIGF